MTDLLVHQNLHGKNYNVFNFILALWKWFLPHIDNLMIPVNILKDTCFGYTRVELSFLFCVLIIFSRIPSHWHKSCKTFVRNDRWFFSFKPHLWPMDHFVWYALNKGFYFHRHSCKTLYNHLIWWLSYVMSPDNVTENVTCTYWPNFWGLQVDYHMQVWL